MDSLGSRLLINENPSRLALVGVGFDSTTLVFNVLALDSYFEGIFYLISVLNYVIKNVIFNMIVFTDKRMLD